MHTLSRPVRSLRFGVISLFALAGCFESTSKSVADSGVGPDGDGGTAPGSCFSPTQNVERAYESGALGCACTDADVDQCVGRAALVCENGRWQAVEDGPCLPQAGDDCKNGKIVATEADCAQDTSCTRLSDGRYCSGGTPPKCPPGAWPIDAETPCPAATACFDVAEGLRCAQPTYSEATCVAAGGMVLADPGDGSTVVDGCPEGGTALGAVSGDWVEGALCCVPAQLCAPQEAHFIGGCEPVGMFYWNGLGCEMRTGCSCLGAGCTAGTPTRQECEEKHASCADTRVFCGGWAGNTCTPSQYCAYVDGDLCGAADAQATCVTRPLACAELDDPVCGCDGKAYGNSCEAAKAGTGVSSYGGCAG